MLQEGAQATGKCIQWERLQAGHRPKLRKHHQKRKMGPICLEEREEKKKRLISKLQKDRQVRLGSPGRVKVDQM